MALLHKQLLFSFEQCLRCMRLLLRIGQPGFQLWMCPHPLHHQIDLLCGPKFCPFFLDFARSCPFHGGVCRFGMSLANAVCATHTGQMDHRGEATELQPEVPIFASCKCLVELAALAQRLCAKQHSMNWHQTTRQLSYGIKGDIKNLP